MLKILDNLTMKSLTVRLIIGSLLERSKGANYKEAKEGKREGSSAKRNMAGYV